MPNLSLRILASYSYHRDVDLDEMTTTFGLPDTPIIADSGAFTAWTSGETVNLEDYAAWLHRWRHRLAGYANLDSIGDPATTLTNQRRLEALGLHPIPVFHFGEPWRYYQTYLEEYPYIMLGGLVGIRERPWSHTLPWLIECFRQAQGRAVLHLLGVSSKSILESLPFYSCDSTSWLSGAKFRDMRLWDDMAVTWRNIDLRQTERVRRFRPLLHSYGIRSEEILNWRGSGSGEIIAILHEIGIAAWIRYERHLRRIHGPVILNETAEPGPKLYYANSPDDWLRLRAVNIFTRAAGSVSH